MPTPKPRTTAADALSLLSAVALASFVIAMLYVARDILIPLALAALITFLLAPLVTRLERWVGRILAVVVVVSMIFALTGAAGWVLTRQFVDLAEKLPDYKENIITKLHTLRAPDNGTISALSATVADLKKELPGAMGGEAGQGGSEAAGGQSAADAPHAPARGREDQASNESPMDLVKSVFAPMLGPLGTAALVLLLVIFMLLQREDLRSRFIRLVGQGHISATTRVMDEAGRRVWHYLLMQLIVNVTYGMAVAIGLYFIGVPNATLWGGFATVLRFIPYVGPWIAAAFPIVVSLAVSPSWTMPALAIGLFVVLELLSNNLMEPWLYGSSIGVAPIALIVATVFWTWLWGPVGLVLAAPLTVCLVVMGRHVKRLSFLSILLSDEEALTPAEDCYHRLLTPGEEDETELIESYLKANSLLALYDAVLIPVITAAEIDVRQEALEPEQLLMVKQSVRDIIQDLGTRPSLVSRPESDAAADGIPLPGPMRPCRVFCLPARAERDELAGTMLVHLLQQQGCDAASASGKLAAGELVGLLENTDVDIVFISAVSPSTVIHARYVCLKVRARFPRMKIIVGLWGAGASMTEATRRLCESGAGAVVGSLAEALVEIARLAPPLNEPMMPAPIPADDEERVAALHDLDLLGTEAEPVFERILAKLARIFEVQVALVALVDRERVFFKSHTGLSEDAAPLREVARNVSVCGHVVANNEAMIVEDLARDHRFATNAWIKERGLRFYAGVPLCAPDGQPIGSLSLFDTRPRQFSKRDMRQLQEYANEIMDIFARRAALGRSPPLVVT